MTSSELSRRDFLKAGVAGAAGIGLAAVGAAPVRGAKKRIPVALQVYSVRKDAGKDLAAVLEAVAKMGYEGVEFAGYYGHKPEAVRKMLDSNGLRCAGTHTGFGALKGDNLKKTVDLHKILGTKFIIVPGGIGKGGTKEAWLEAAKQFSEIAGKLKGDGMMTGYHNHSHEFKKVDGGETLWDVFFSNTPTEVCHQIDTGNCMGGGGDPVSFIKKYAGRTRTVHLKEHGGPGNFGEGTCPWNDIFAACETVGGTEWYIVEQESYKNRTPLEAVKQCMDYMKKVGKAKA
jgi:sugar phosphate isomerase/epimerase